MRAFRLSGTPASVLIAAALLVAAFVVPRTAGAHAIHAPASKSQTLTAAFAESIPSLDPAVGYDPFTWTGEHAIFNALLNYKNAQGVKGTQLVPDIAAALPKITSGGKVYTFKLRHNVRFAPPVNRVVTAADFKYSIERALSKNTPNAAMYQSPFWAPLAGTASFWSGKSAHISGIVVKNKFTIQFRLTSPDLAFQNVLAMPFASAVPHEWVKKEGKNFTINPVGTGPYRLQSFRQNQQMVLVKNPNYFRKGLPHVGRVVIQFGVNTHLQIQRAQKNQLDLPGDFVTSQDYLALRTGPDAKLLAHVPDIAVFYLAMNTQMKPFKGNLTLRRAFNMAIDKSHILRLLNGRGIQMNGILPPTMPGANKHFTYYKYSLKAAKALMKKAGYGKKHLTITMLLNGDSPDNITVATAVQQDLKNIGVKVILHPVPASTAYGLVYTPGKSAFTLFTWGEDYPDPSDFFDPILSCSSGSNAAFFCNKAVDQLGDKARATTNKSKRYAIYRQMEKMVMAKAPWVPLYDDVEWEFHSAKVKGFFIHPVWPFNYDQYRL